MERDPIEAGGATDNPARVFSRAVIDSRIGSAPGAVKADRIERQLAKKFRLPSFLLTLRPFSQENLERRRVASSRREKIHMEVGVVNGRTLSCR